MRKISPKTAWYALISVNIVMVLGMGACMKPVDVQLFLEDEKVIEIIESTKGSVKITRDSDPGLIPGNGKISGLIPGKYYKIEVMENGVPEETSFVRAAGTLSGELKDIRKVARGVITELENDHIYRVKSAKPYSDTASEIKYFAFDGEGTKDATLTGGVVTITESRAGCYFDVSKTIAVDRYYEVTNVGKWIKERTSACKKENTGQIVDEIKKDNYQQFNEALDYGIYQYDPAKKPVVTTPNFLDGMSIMELPAGGTKNDFVFVEYYAPDPAFPKKVITRDFYVLTVNVNQPPNTGDGNDITITKPNPPTDETITLTPTPTTDEIITFSINTPNKTITATAAIGATYEWYDGNYTPLFSSLQNLNIDENPNLNKVGTYTIVVEAKIVVKATIVNYSKWFILKITP